MSTEEIIHAWKHELPGEAPANPAGEQGLSDEEVAIIEEGGSFVCSCPDYSCYISL